MIPNSEESEYEVAPTHWQRCDISRELLFKMSREARTFLCFLLSRSSFRFWRPYRKELTAFRKIPFEDHICFSLGILQDLGQIPHSSIDPLPWFMYPFEGCGMLPLCFRCALPSLFLRGHSPGFWRLLCGQVENQCVWERAAHAQGLCQWLTDGDVWAQFSFLWSR